jgi:hypothetical protein
VVGGGASVAGTGAARTCDQDPEESVDRTIGLERSVELARAWDTGDSEHFENWLHDMTDQLYELSARRAGRDG